jgi:hypothetical protein
MEYFKENTIMKDGGPAFAIPAWLSPAVDEHGVQRPEFGNAVVPAQRGMSLRDYFAAQAPEPSIEDITREQSIDRGKNPHNDSYKPRLREREEIICFLRYKRADAMLAEREK